MNDIQQNNTMENSGINVTINSLTRNQSQVSIFNSKKVLDYEYQNTFGGNELFGVRRMGSLPHMYGKLSGNSRIR